MTDAFWNSPVLIAIINLIGFIYIGWSQRQTARDAREALIVAKKTEINTNSMKDALVKATEDAALRKGQQDERIAGDARRESEKIGREEVRREIANKKLDAVVSSAVDLPLPVTDTRTADAAEKSATALDRLATATEKKEG